MSRAGHYLFYDADGRIVGAFFGKPGEVARNTPADTTALATGSAPDPATEYVADGERTTRPAMAATLSGLVLSDLPDPCDIIIEGTRYPTSGGTATLEFDLPGTYVVTVEAWPYQVARFEAVAP